MLAKQNIPEDTMPCAIIMSIAPMKPQFVKDKTPTIIIPICPIEEYAINDFRSAWRRQIIDAKIAPIIATADTVVTIVAVCTGN